MAKDSSLCNVTHHIRSSRVLVLQQRLRSHPLDGAVLVVAEAVVVVGEQVSRQTVVRHFQSQFLINSEWEKILKLDKGLTLPYRRCLRFDCCIALSFLMFFSIMFHLHPLFGY